MHCSEDALIATVFCLNVTGGKEGIKIKQMDVCDLSHCQLTIDNAAAIFLEQRLGI